MNPDDYEFYSENDKQGICPACKLLTNPAIHASITLGSTDEINLPLIPFVEWQMYSLNHLFRGSPERGE